MERVDPSDPLNAVITDIDLAPRNARGNVEYEMDIYFLKPVDLHKGNHRVFMDVNNRGSKRFGPLNNSPNTNNPTTAEDAGEAFFMRRGYTLVWSGWDPLVSEGSDRLTMTVPVATNAGETITGPSYEYINFDNDTTETYTLAYPAATLDKSGASLTVKQFLNDPPTPIPASDWEYVDETTTRLLPEGTTFEQSHIYEFTYTAKDPRVLGLGLADLPDPKNVRFFLISGGRHGVGNPESMGVCQQFDNPTDAYTAMRALFVALDKWVSWGIPPPHSRVPRFADGTAVFSVPQPDTVTGIVPQDELGFPEIPGVTYNSVVTTRYLFDFGPEFDSEGIISLYPPDFVGAPTYPSAVSKTDEDADRGHPPADRRGAGRHDHGLGAAPGGLRPGRRLRERRPEHPVRDHARGAADQR
jgi:hypothetical protein